MTVDVRAGVHEDYPAATTADRFPGARWTHPFVAGRAGAPLPNTTTADQLVAQVLTQVTPVLSTGGGSFVAIKLDMADVARGLWDTRMQALGVALVGLNIVVILNHEPENNYRAGMFVPGFTRGRAALKSTAPDLDVAYCAMAYQWRPGSAMTKDPTAWAAVDADLYLIDVYSGKSFPETAILPDHPGWKRWYGEVVAKFPGRRWGVAERGWLASPTRPLTIAREAAWLASDPVGKTCEAYIVWATGGTEKNAGWLLDDKAEAAVEKLLSLITLPAGYEAVANRELILHSTSGAVIARDRVAAWDATYERLIGIAAVAVLGA